MGGRFKVRITFVPSLRIRTPSLLVSWSVILRVVSLAAGTLKKKEGGAVVTEAELNAALDPRAMTEPSKS